MSTEILKALPLIPLVGGVVDTWLKPALVEMRKSQQLEKDFREHRITSKFSEYLILSYKRQSHLSTIVFKDPNKLLKDLYVPLTVSGLVSTTRILHSIRIDSFKEEFLPKFQHVIVTDGAGMGKSTLSRFLFLTCIEQNAAIPIFIELRHLTGTKSILELIHEELNPLDDELNLDFILALIKVGNFVFFFDGYDEIPFLEREKVTKNLQDFISKAGNNSFMITSREDAALKSFANFQKFSIRPLEVEEAFTLLRKYDESGKLAELLIMEVNRQLASIREFLSNPMLASLLYKAYEYKNELPLKKHIFYRQVFDALFNEHDLTKPLFKRQKYSNLDVDDFESVLRALG